MKAKTTFFFIAISIVAMSMLAQNVFAAEAQTGKNTFDLVTMFQKSTEGWDKTLRGYTIIIFQSLMAIEIIFLGIKAALEGSAKHDTLRQLVMIILFGGFILAVINNHHEWSQMIIGGFTKIATITAPTDFASGEPLEIGLGLAGKVLANVSGWKPFDSLGYIITGLIILICFAQLSAQVIYIKCSTIISLGASLVLLGFGGSSFTKEYALNAIRFVLSVAFRLFVLNLLLGVGASLIKGINISNSPSYEELFMIIGASVVLLALVSRLPDEAASILNGSNISSGMALMQTARTVAAGSLAGMKMAKTIAGGAAGAVGGAARTVGALRNANQLANMDGKSGLGKAGSMAKNLWNSRQQANAELPGQSTLKRMNSNMKEQIQAKKHDQNLGGVGNDSNGK